MDYKKRDELSLIAAHRIFLSPHEHTWTQDEQFEMARHLIEATKIIRRLIDGLDELSNSGFGVSSEIEEIYTNSNLRDYLIFNEYFKKGN